MRNFGGFKVEIILEPSKIWENFNFSIEIQIVEILLGDKDATSLCSKNISTLKHTCLVCWVQLSWVRQILNVEYFRGIFLTYTKQIQTVPKVTDTVKFKIYLGFYQLKNKVNVVCMSSCDLLIHRILNFEICTNI